MPNERWDGEDRRQKNFWNGTATKILALLFGVLAFLSGYVFTEVTAMPKTYAEKAAVNLLRDKIDNQYEKLRDSIAEINRFLRESHNR